MLNEVLEFSIAPPQAPEISFLKLISRRPVQADRLGSGSNLVVNFLFRTNAHNFFLSLRRTAKDNQAWPQTTSSGKPDESQQGK